MPTRTPARCALLAARDEGAARLGEVALVDRESRIGQLGRVFSNTLVDENAASHIAIGTGFPMIVDDAGDRDRVNESEIHIDFMIGSDERRCHRRDPRRPRAAAAAPRRMADLIPAPLR